MKTLIIIIILLFTVKSVENNHFDKDICFDFNDDLMIAPVNLPTELMYRVVYTECQGCGLEELTGVINVIMLRQDTNIYPNCLNDILLQPDQFSVNLEENPTNEFKKLVDSIYSQPIKYRFLYFANIDLVKQWVKEGKTRQSTLDWFLSKPLIPIGKQHFF